MISFMFFFFNDTATTEIYTLSLHDALPIFLFWSALMPAPRDAATVERVGALVTTTLLPLDDIARQEKVCTRDRKSTRLNSSHANISYAVFCLKKKKQIY